MLIRNACLWLDGQTRLGMELRLMHGAVQEIGCGLVKGLYESELDLQGDLLLPGMVIARTQVTAAELRQLYRQGVALVATDAAVPGRVMPRSARTILVPREQLMLLPGVPSPRPPLPDWDELEHYRRIRPGSPSPLSRWTQAGAFVSVIDEHTAD